MRIEPDKGSAFFLLLSYHPLQLILCFLLVEVYRHDELGIFFFIVFHFVQNNSNYRMDSLIRGWTFVFV